MTLSFLLSLKPILLAGTGMDLTIWGPWAQDLVGALLKLQQGDSSTRFVGRSVRKKNVKKIENI